MGWHRGLTLPPSLDSSSWQHSTISLKTKGWIPESVVSFLLEQLNMQFRQDVHLARVQCPVLLLHAEDDPKIPLALASTLVDTIKAVGKTDVELEVENNSTTIIYQTTA